MIKPAQCFREALTPTLRAISDSVLFWEVRGKRFDVATRKIEKHYMWVYLKKVIF